ncbi:MAG: response regulator transcription factor [Deltaproteobacteria bacterium]|nr:response regulator transcription factor [Deltaproteobacteria bacterium]
MPKDSYKILAVDDEADILKLLEYNLKKAGFRVVTAKDGPEGLHLARRERPNLILLDIMLPDMDGAEILKRLKTEDSTRHIPVVMLTAKGEEIDRVLGFELGAEDYITKPFSPRELVLRVRAILKRASETEAAPEIFTFKDLSIDFSRHRAFVKGARIELTATEFKLLRALALAKGRVLTRETVLDKAWGIDCFVTPRTVDTHVRRLREKLKAAGKYIETVRGAGYRFAELGD